MTASTPSGEAAKEILALSFQNDCDQQQGHAFMMADELTKRCAAIIERHCPSPDIAGMRKAALEEAAKIADSFNDAGDDSIAPLLIAEKIRALASNSDIGEK